MEIIECFFFSAFSIFYIYNIYFLTVVLLLLNDQDLSISSCLSSSVAQHGLTV